MATVNNMAVGYNMAMVHLMSSPVNPKITPDADLQLSGGAPPRNALGLPGCERHALLVPEGDKWIDVRGAAGGQQARDQADRDNDDHHDAESQRIRS